jgi:hypothetical protein
VARELQALKDRQDDQALDRFFQNLAPETRMRHGNKKALPISKRVRRLHGG